MLPDLGDSLVDVVPAGGDHLVGDLDKERGHPLGGVVVGGDTVDHTDGVHQAGDVLQHCGLTETKQGHG